MQLLSVPMKSSMPALRGCTQTKILFTILLVIVMTFTHAADIAWENRIQLDENYLLQWKLRQPDEIVFEVHVGARGYIGFGLSRDGTIYGSDIFISWIDDGHMFFYVSKHSHFLNLALNALLIFILDTTFTFPPSPFGVIDNLILSQSVTSCLLSLFLPSLHY